MQIFMEALHAYIPPQLVINGGGVSRPREKHSRYQQRLREPCAQNDLYRGDIFRFTVSRCYVVACHGASYLSQAFKLLHTVRMRALVIRQLKYLLFPSPTSCNSNLNHSSFMNDITR